MKTLFHYAAGEKLRQMLQPHQAVDFEIAYAPEGPDEPFLTELVDADVIWHILHPLNASVLGRAKNLKLIQKIGVGVNTIDLDYARANNIAVCNMPGTNSRAVAEMTLLLMLSTLRRLPQVNRGLRNGVWVPPTDIKDSFREVGGLRVGFVGFGQTPQILAPVLTAMGAHVSYHNRTIKDMPYEYQSFGELVSSSDIVSLHLPLMDNTKGIMNANVFSQMKAGAVLINTARGELVDEEALINALNMGHLEGAGLDVFAREPVGSDNPLLSHEKVVATPHIAWLTEQTWRRSFDIAVANARAVMNGDPLQYRVA